MLTTRALARGGSQEYHSVMAPTTKEPVQIWMTPAQAHGHFKTATLTSADTVVIVRPKPGRSIWVTDILVTGEKQAGSNTIIQFTDGVNTEIIMQAYQVTVPPQIAGNLQAYLRGWKDARIEMITSGAADATCTIGYIHALAGPDFAEWDAER